MNRRGSRSEGRICIAVQDRLAAEVAERIKKEQAAKKEVQAKEKPRIGLIDGISGIKIIKNDNKEQFLGQAGGGMRKDARSHSVDKTRQMAARTQDDVKFLTESSTLVIPSSNSGASQVSKPFKTMPSPSRPASISNTSNCLNEIFEECDAGSSDNNSNSNTPRAIARSQANPTHHRRTKFHKSRTTSGSSSDEENADKKRATKIIDSAIAKQFTQRRDSHDDSSDSQDPGTNCSGNSNAAVLLRNGSTSSKPTSQADDRNSHDNRGKRTSNSLDIVGFRKHRTGRRRQTETRLRESQSLNRITEVQECDLNSNIMLNFDKAEKLRNEKVDGEQAKTKPTSCNQSGTGQTLNTIVHITNELKANKNQNNSKAKGFGARFLQNLNFKKHQEASNVPFPKASPKSDQKKAASQATGCAIQQKEVSNDGNDRSKKMKILGRYFQVSSFGCVVVVVDCDCVVGF